VEELINRHPSNIKEKASIAKAKKEQEGQPKPFSRVFIVKGEKGLSAVQVDLSAKTVTKSNLFANDECSNVFSECLHVQRQLPQDSKGAGTVKIV